MIYYTGDIHGDPYEVIQFCDSKKLTEQDTLVLLGDVGANYYRNRRDTEMKRVLAAVKPTMLCIHGNHEIRPASIPSYRTKQWNGGTVWVEEAFPRLTGAEAIGIVPEGVFPAYCHDRFPGESIVDFMNLPRERQDELAKYCRWQPIPVPRMKKEGETP